jgi:ATP-dependent Clp protease ATP-binding subunit ClpA
MKMLGTMAPFDHVTDLLGLKLEGEKISTSVDLPLAAEAKRVLKFAAEEATAMSMENIAPAHLLIGMFREPSAARDLLQKLGLDSVKVRAAMQGAVEGPTSVQIVTALRLQFGSLTSRLKPEMEPAVVYSLNREKVK